MKEWRNASKEDIENMSIYEAIEILERHITNGEYAMKHPKESAYAPREHMTHAMKLVVDAAKSTLKEGV